MSRIWVAVVVVCVAAYPAVSVAADISAKKISIKDNADPAKRQLQAASKDAGVQFSQADNPATNGAALHAYSATDDFCAVLPAGANWKSKNSVWKFSDKATKTSAQIGDGKLSVKMKSGVTYSLADNGTQGTVNVIVQFGTGTRYCMRCSAPKKDTAKKYLGKGCAAAPCDEEPSSCPPASTTTTAPTTTTSMTTTTGAGQIVVGSLAATPGRFNYNLTLGLPGANAACNSNFAGSHACTLAELQSAPASELTGLKDTLNMTVTSFWAIDPSADPVTAQCFDDANFNPVTQPGHNWEYGTAHTISRGQQVPLNNGTGVIGALQTGIQCNISGTSWVGCCL